MMVSSLKEALENRLKSLKVNRKLIEMKSIAAWDDIVGQGLTKQTQAVKMTDGKLFIIVSNSVWVHQLTFFKREYIAKINKRLGNPTVKDIIFFVGTPDRGFKTKEENAEKEEKTTVWIDLSENETETIRSTASSIHSEEIRKAFENLMEKDFIRKKIRKKEGWESCKICGVPCPPEEKYCRFCWENQKTEEEKRLMQIFHETPWITYEEINSQLPDLTRNNYIRVKEKMKTELIQLFHKKNPGKNFETINSAMIYTMLVTGCTPDALNHIVINKTIGDDLYQAVFGNCNAE